MAGFHHVALATRDLARTVDFCTEVMGFRLVKVIVAPTPEGGWAKHAFLDTGAGSRQLMAFWDLHDETIGTDFPTDLNKSLGLPEWVNHIAFDAATIDDLENAKERWRAHGITVAQIDHGFCRSIYATDPNGILVEFCCTTRDFSTDEMTAAQRLIADPSPELEPMPDVEIFRPLRPPVPAR